jgi:hypothetical protein
MWRDSTWLGAQRVDEKEEISARARGESRVLNGAGWIIISLPDSEDSTHGRIHIARMI